jgi:hypothetical protein
MAPAGGLRSSARDMATFLTACLNKTGPLRPAFDATVQAQRDDEESGVKIALGWMLVGAADRLVVWHNGATAGSRAFVGFNPAAGIGVAIMANNATQAPEGLGLKLLGAEMPKPRDAKVRNAADYRGRYPLSPEFAITVTVINGALFCQATGQPQLAMLPAGPDRFAIGGVNAEISFERGADGKVTGLVLHQNGRDLPGPRGEIVSPKMVTLPAETLAEYPGDYPLAPTFVLKVTVENGAVFVQATGQSKLAVYSSAKDEFFYTVVEARISFTRDASGKVNGLVLHQNGREMPAARK